MTGNGADRKAAKELLHIEVWLNRVDEIAERDKEAYLGDDLLQEAGDSLMMKLGGAANRLSKLDVLAPEGVAWPLVVAYRNFLIHQYDEINRELTWLTLSRDLLSWKASLPGHFEASAAAVGEDETGPARSRNPLTARSGDLVRPVTRQEVGCSGRTSRGSLALATEVHRV